MKKHICVILLFLSTALFGQQQQYENLVIEKIDVTLVNVPKDSESDENAVRARMKTKTGGLFSQADFDSDLKRLVLDFDHVVPVVECVDNKIYITLKVWPKPSIRTIRWQGNEKIKTKKLQGELGISSFSVFDRKDFNAAFHKLKAYYVRKGFFEAELDYTITPDPHSNEVDIEIFINEGRSGRVRDIFFVNFTDAEMEAVMEMMITKQYNIFMSWVTGEGTYNEDAVRQDEFVILNYMQDQGYADAKVRIEIKESKRDNNIALYIVAEKGEKYKIGKLTIDGNTIFPEETLRSLFLVKEGGAYSPELIRETARRIMEYYGRKGYIDAIVDFEPRLDYGEYSYSVHFVVEEGKEYRIGLIKVFGNCSTQTNVILNESLLIPGDVFNSLRLKMTEERLRNVGFFKNVNVYAVKSDGPCGLGENYRDVHIEIEEMSTGSASASIGFSTVESIYGSANITERNFNIRGLGCLWSQGLQALRGGGEYSHLTATIGLKSRSYVLAWMKPYFRDTKWTIGFNLEKNINQYITDRYDLESYGFTFNASYQINAFLRYGWHYRLKHSRVYNLHFNDNHEGETEEEAIEREKKEQQEKEAIEKIPSLISAVGATLVYDSTNHPITPTCGFKSKLEGEIAGLGGEVNFFSAGYLNSYYYPLRRRWTLKLRGDLRFIQPVGVTGIEEIPIDERLFLGQDTVIRGYRDFRIGPVVKGTPVGGISMSLFSTEVQYNVNERIDAFCFFDAGSLSGRQWRIGRIYQSVGYGLRLYIMGNTPITVGMGYPLNPRNRSDVKKFFFQMGGRF